MPCRYLPVSTPRPSGAQARKPSPCTAAAGSTDCSGPRSSSEYSASHRHQRAARRRRRAASRPGWPAASRSPRTPRHSGRGRSRRPSRSAEQVSSNGTAASNPCTCHRSTWSVPSRLSEPSSAASSRPRPPPTPTVVVDSTTDDAADHVRHQGAEDRLGVPVAVDVGGVDQRAAGPDEGLQLRPRRRRRRCPGPRSWCRAPSRDTSSPLRPTRRESMTANLSTAGRRLTRVRGGARYRDRALRRLPRQSEPSPQRRRSDVRRTRRVTPARNASPSKGRSAAWDNRMRIGLNLGYVTTAEELADNLALAQAAESLGFDTRVGGRGLRLGRGDGAGRRRRPHPPDRHRLRGPADPRPHPGDDGDDGRHPGRAVRPGGSRLGPRRVRPAGVRGLARRPVRRSARPHPGVRADRPAGAEAAPGDRRRRRISPCRCRTGRASRWCWPCSRSGRRSRSTWPRSGRRTST